MHCQHNMQKLTQEGAHAWTQSNSIKILEGFVNQGGKDLFNTIPNVQSTKEPKR
jgi:hypothetical protein